MICIDKLKTKRTVRCTACDDFERISGRYVTCKEIERQGENIISDSILDLHVKCPIKVYMENEGLDMAIYI
jgi:hypothetical protein